MSSVFLSILRLYEATAGKELIADSKLMIYSFILKRYFLKGFQFILQSFEGFYFAFPFNKLKIVYFSIK